MHINGHWLSITHTRYNTIPSASSCWELALLRSHIVVIALLLTGRDGRQWQNKRLSFFYINPSISGHLWLTDIMKGVLNKEANKYPSHWRTDPIEAA